MLKSGIDELEIGDWCFQDLITPDGNRIQNGYIALRFLDGDRGFAILPIWGVAEAETPPNGSAYNVLGKACWIWNGSKEAPTLSPSILHWGDGKDHPATWHGFLRDGKLITA